VKCQRVNRRPRCPSLLSSPLLSFPPRHTTPRIVWHPIPSHRIALPQRTASGARRTCSPTARGPACRGCGRAASHTRCPGTSPGSSSAPRSLSSCPRPPPPPPPSPWTRPRPRRSSPLPGSARRCRPRGCRCPPRRMQRRPPCAADVLFVFALLHEQWEPGERLCTSRLKEKGARGAPQ
jgi:hypothetical protein